MPDHKKAGGDAQSIPLEERIWLSELAPDALLVLRLPASNRYSENFGKRNLIPFHPNQLNSLSAISFYLPPSTEAASIQSLNRVLVLPCTGLDLCGSICFHTHKEIGSYLRETKLCRMSAKDKANYCG